MLIVCCALKKGIKCTLSHKEGFNYMYLHKIIFLGLNVNVNIPEIMMNTDIINVPLAIFLLQKHFEYMYLKCNRTLCVQKATLIKSLDSFVHIDFPQIDNHCKL